MGTTLKPIQIFNSLLFSLLLLTVVACDSSSDDDTDPVNDKGNQSKTTVTIPVTLDGMQAEISTSATASASLDIDTSTGALSGSVTVTGLAADNSIANVHIHLGNPGESGLPIAFFEAEAGASPASKWNIKASTVLSADNLAVLLAGGTYLNVHTKNVAAGELRGQILPTDYTMTMTTLSGEQQVPAAITSALTATGYTLVNTVTGALKARIKISDGTNVSQAHIHSGKAGTNGGIAKTLTKNMTDATLYEVSDTLDTTQLAAYNAGGLYFNIHTTANGTGELRGQILPPNIVVVRTELNNLDMLSTGTGIGYITLNKTSGDVVSNIRVQGVTGTLAHIHEGAVGATGSAVLSFTNNSADATLWEASGNFKSDQITKFNMDGLYYNVHSAAFTAGEIRGQIEP